MSWSITVNSAKQTSLDSALTEAQTNKIVMFCSSIDEGPTARDLTYPGNHGQVIKIGAATAKGGRLSWVSRVQ